MRLNLYDCENRGNQVLLSLSPPPSAHAREPGDKAASADIVSMIVTSAVGPGPV